MAMTETDFGARKCHVIKRTCLTLLLSIAGNAICPVTLPEEFSRLRVEALTHCLEIFGGNLSFEPNQVSAASLPLAFDGPILVVVVALLEMTLRVTLSAGHGTNRQHSLTLALFEIEDQVPPFKEGRGQIGRSNVPSPAKPLVKLAV
jgi:hypothetical protein